MKSYNQIQYELGVGGQHGYYFMTIKAPMEPWGKSKGWSYWSEKSNVMNVVQQWTEYNKTGACYAWRKHDTDWKPVINLKLTDLYGSHIIWNEFPERNFELHISPIGKKHWELWQNYETLDELVFITRRKQPNYWMSSLIRVKEELEEIKNEVKKANDISPDLLLDWKSAVHSRYYLDVNKRNE